VTKPARKANPLAYFWVGLRYRAKMGRWPDLKTPKRYTEHIQVAKLTWRSPVMSRVTDKVTAKTIVGGALGEEWITPNLYVGRTLPPRDQRTWPTPYVIKTNHASGRMHFVMTDADKDWDLIDRKFKRWLSMPYGRKNCEWGYRGIEPKVLVEPFLGGDASPDDLKFLVFDGRVELIRHVSGRKNGPRFESYDRTWQIYDGTIRIGMLQPDRPMPKPPALDKMIAAAELLSAPFPFVRVDFYDLGEHPRFGEITFYPLSGHLKMDPPEFDQRLGALCPDRLPDASLPY